MLQNKIVLRNQPDEDDAAKTQPVKAEDIAAADK